ncbi:hypothetical protein NPIL_112901 [Nephila pilipes]|uniref:Uncharacterized protein n=1 Tax=Nephila pilipes TaxID=299642 RepID=A0A8X6Q4S9_NEPPI|nr:hypothetical protein NPIL_112901 [Nephila pilipes]
MMLRSFHIGSSVDELFSPLRRRKRHSSDLLQTQQKGSFSSERFRTLPRLSSASPMNLPESKVEDWGIHLE